jgi:hypothetical protein
VPQGALSDEVADAKRFGKQRIAFANYQMTNFS